MAKKNGTVDLRIKRTQSAIKSAFFELIEEKEFEHISVKDITDRAMISRNTFYLHYSDKYDLFNKICDDLMRTLFFRSGKQLRRVQQKEFTVESTASIIKCAINAVEEDREAYRILFSVSGASEILTDKINVMARRFMDFIKDDIDGISEWTMAYIVSGITGVIRYHVMHGAQNIDLECENFARIHLKSIIEIVSESRSCKNK